MKFFFSCDWGTSAFRLRLVDMGDLKVVSEIKTGYGIAAAFESWKKAASDEQGRKKFYQAYLFEQVKKITQSYNVITDNVPILLSGMASSSIGMMELPYKRIPFHYSGSDLVIHTIPLGTDIPNKIIIISGGSSDKDVVRGEETMLAGCNIINDDTEQLFIFPGTHSKHLVVKNDMVKDITTYMTGEFFDLLSNKSILSTSVKKNNPEQINDQQFFVEGVLEGIAASLSNSIFHVRTNQLFNKATPGENYEYLSGLLIGHELKAIVEKKPASITLVCGEGLKKSYANALDILTLNTNWKYKNADDALIEGQWKILKQKNDDR